MTGDKGETRTEANIIRDLRNSLIALEQRQLTARQVQSAVWKIWGYNRNNRDSLDSERACKEIDAVITGAVVSVNERAESLALQLDVVKDELRTSKKEEKRLTSALATASSKIARLQKELDEQDNNQAASKADTEAESKE